MTIDLNCDLGEGEPLPRMRALMKWITSANIACGGHAGDARSMEQCVIEARRRGVKIGAHPGTWDREGFGRRRIEISTAEFKLLLLHQVGALAAITPLHHIKLHGALYRLSEARPAVAKFYIRTVKRFWPTAAIYAPAGGRVAREARKAKLKLYEEAFADRAYRNALDLVDRREPGAVLMTKAAIKQMQLILNDGVVQTLDTGRVSLRAHTICVHSDTPGATAIARAIRELLKGWHARRNK